MMFESLLNNPKNRRKKNDKKYSMSQIYLTNNVVYYYRFFFFFGKMTNNFRTMLTKIKYCRKKREINILHSKVVSVKFIYQTNGKSK